jgi:hypothetical protein
MSGLIWAGLGKGIADAGAAYGGAMARAAEFDYKTQEEERSFQRKLDMEDKRAESLKQRVIREIEEVNKTSADVAAKRDAAQFNKDAGAIAGVAGQVAGASPAMSQEEISQLMKDNPQYRETYRKAGLIDKAMSPDQQRLQTADDKVQGALQIGAHSSVVDAFQKSKKDVLEQIREENKERRDMRREDRMDAAEERRSKEFQALLPIRQQTADAATDRANRPTGKPDTGDKPPTGIDLERNAKAAEKALALELGVPVKDVPETVARLRKQNKITADAQTKLDAYNSSLTEWQNYKKKSVASATAPSGNNAGSSSSKDYSNLWK